MSIGIALRPARSRRSWPASTPRCLGVERVGVDESFFELGGDSLSAMRVIGAVNWSGCRPWGAGRVRGAHGCPVGVAYRVGCRVDWSRLVAVERPAVVPLSFAQHGCGSWTSCRGLHRFTTWRWRCGWAGALTPRRWVRRWPMWWAAMRACARCSPAPEGIPQQLVVPAERADLGWQVVDAAGWSASRLDEAVEAAAGYRLTWPPRSRAGKAFPRRR